MVDGKYSYSHFYPLFRKVRPTSDDENELLSGTIHPAAWEDVSYGGKHLAEL